MPAFQASALNRSATSPTLYPRVTGILRKGGLRAFQVVCFRKRADTFPTQLCELPFWEATRGKLAA
jgi:hypothetical protein